MGRVCSWALPPVSAPTKPRRVPSSEPESIRGGAARSPSAPPGRGERRPRVRPHPRPFPSSRWGPAHPRCQRCRRHKPPPRGPGNAGRYRGAVGNGTRRGGGTGRGEQKGGAARRCPPGPARPPERRGRERRAARARPPASPPTPPGPLHSWCGSGAGPRPPHLPARRLPAPRGLTRPGLTSSRRRDRGFPCLSLAKSIPPA